MLRAIEMAPHFVKLYLSPECHGTSGYQHEEEFTQLVWWHMVSCKGDLLEGILG